MDKYADLTLKEVDVKIEALNKIVESSFFNPAVAISFLLILVCVVSIFAVLDTLDEDNNNVRYLWLSVTGMVVSITIFSVLMHYASDHQRLTELRSELVEKQEQKVEEDSPVLTFSMKTSKTIDLTVESIITKVAVNDKYCPEKQKDEECVFIEFVGGEEKSQAIIPFHPKNLIGAGIGLQLTYYDITVSQFNEYINYFNLQDKYFLDHKVFIDYFVVGKSLTAKKQ